jgi:hypothetical protein
MQRGLKVLSPCLLVCIVTSLALSGCTGAAITTTVPVITSAPPTTAEIITTSPPAETTTAAITTTPPPATIASTIVETTTPALTTPVRQLTPEEQIVADAMSYFEELNSYTFDVVLGMTMVMTSGNQTGSMVIKSNYGGGVDLAAKNMQLLLDMSMTSETPMDDFYSENDTDRSQTMIYDSQNMSLDMYVLEDWVYMRTESDTEPETWIKSPTTNMDDAFNLDLVKQQTVMLDSPSKIEFLRSEIVDGINCDVYSVTPDKAALERYLNKQTGATGLNTVDYGDMLKSLSYICYIAKDTNLLERISLNLVLEMTEENAGPSMDWYDKLVMTMTMDMNVGGHGQPFNLTLPDEAADAIEQTDNTSLN